VHETGAESSTADSRHSAYFALMTWYFPGISAAL
jgi:hypothetical protein